MWYNCTLQVISHRGYKCREDFDDQITAALEEAKVDVVCLAGFMRILSGKFVTSPSDILLFNIRTFYVYTT